MEYKFKAGDVVALKSAPSKKLTVEYCKEGSHKPTHTQKVFVYCKHYDRINNLFQNEVFIEEMLDAYLPFSDEDEQERPVIGY